jgi:hypothetical protein
MRIRNMSQFSGKYHEFDINVTSDQILDWLDGALIQDAMPNLKDWEREFIKTGVTPEEWDATFGYDDLDIGLV